MKKIISALLFLFLALSLHGCAHRHVVEYQETIKYVPVVYADWRAERRVLKERSEHPSYILDVHYPEFVSHPDTMVTRDLNAQIQNYIQTSIQNFKDHAPADSFEFADYPDQMRLNRFRTFYQLTFIKPRGHTIVSIRFETETRYAGESTNLHHFAVFNYDLSAGKRLTLASLFRPDADYLENLASYCQVKLRKRLAQDMIWMPWDREGSLPEPENFRIWNLDRKGVVITFQEYQVTPYSSEPQAVRVPYYHLRPILSPASPVSAYAYM